MIEAQVSASTGRWILENKNVIFPLTMLEITYPAVFVQPCLCSYWFNAFSEDHIKFRHQIKSWSILEPFKLRSAEKLYGESYFILQQEWTPASYQSILGFHYLSRATDWSTTCNTTRIIPQGCCDLLLMNEYSLDFYFGFLIIINCPFLMTPVKC